MSWPSLLEEAAVDEVVALDPGEGDGVVRLAEGGHSRRIGEERKRCALPHAPGTRGREADVRVVAGEALVVGGDHVAALACRDRRDEVLPRHREG